MNKAVVFGLLLLVLIVPMTSGAAEIKVNTVPARDVTIVLQEPVKEYQLIKSFTEVFSGPKGEVSASYVGEKTEFHIRVIVKYHGEIIVNEFFENENGPSIELDVYPEDYEVPTEEETVEPVIVENTTVEETLEVPEAKSPTTGFAILGEGKQIPSFVYIVALVFIFGVVAFFVMRNRSTHPKEPNPKIFSQAKSAVVDKEGNIDDDALTSDDQKALDEAQKKVEEAQAEINRIKNKDKIREAEAKLKKDQDELEKLKTGRDSYY